MSTPSTSALLLLTGRWCRTRGMRRSALLLAVTFLVLAAIFVCVSSLAPTAQQQADAGFGSYTQSTYTSVPLGDLEPGVLPRARAALSGAVPRSSVYIQTDRLRPDPYARLYIQAPIATVQFLEGTDLRQAFPGRFTLEQGAWPVSPFEVVVSRKVMDALPDQEQFTVLSGRARLRVTGVVQDSYARHGDVIIAAPGTWESIPLAAPGRQYQPVDAQVTVLFGSDGKVEDVAGVLDGVLPPLPAEQGTRLEGLVSNHSVRQQAGSQDGPAPGQLAGERDLVVSYVPLVLVVLLVSTLVTGQTRTEQRRSADRLVAIGVRRGHVRLTQITALMVTSAAAIAVGLAAGWLAAIALRATILPSLADQPLSPLPGPDGTQVAIAALSLVLVLAGALWPERRPAAAGTFAQTLAGIPADLLRRLAIVLLALTALNVDLSTGQRSHVLAASYLTLTAVVLAAPDLLRLALRGLAHDRARTFVLRRLMQADYSRQAAAATVVAISLAVPICAGTQLASQKTAEQAMRYSRVPAGQIWVANAGGPGSGDARGAANVVSAVAGSPIELRDLTLPPDQQGISQRVGRFRNLAANGGTAVLVVDSVRQLSRLLDDDLTDSAAALEAGAVLDFTGTPGDQQVGVLGAGGADPEFVTPPLRTIKTTVDRSISSRFSGAILLRTAKDLSLPVSEPGTYVFTDTSPSIVTAAVAAVVEAGYDTDFAQYNVAPPPPDLPTSAYVFLVGLALGGFAVLLLTVRGQARRLREYSARLVALGLRPRWVLGLLLIQSAVIVGVGLLLGVAAGIAGVHVTSLTYPVVTVPVLPIAFAVGLSLLSAATAVALAVRALTSTGHVETAYS